MGKAVAPLILLGIDRHGAETDFLFPGIHFPAIRRKHGFYRIKRLLTVTVRPPELRISDKDAAIRLLSVNFTVGRKNLYGHLRFLCRKIDQIGTKRQADRTVPVILHHIHTVNFGFFYFFQINRAENTGIRQSGPPVPSKHTVGFSKMRKSLHTFQAAPGVNFFILFFNVTDGGMQYHLQHIFPDF